MTNLVMRSENGTNSSIRLTQIVTRRRKTSPELTHSCNDHTAENRCFSLPLFLGGGSWFCLPSFLSSTSLAAWLESSSYKWAKRNFWKCLLSSYLFPWNTRVIIHTFIEFGCIIEPLLNSYSSFKETWLPILEFLTH